MDADGLIYIVGYNKVPKEGEEPVPNKTLQECKDQIDDLIRNILKITKADHYLLFLTVGKNFRYEIYPEYKGNRKGEKPEHFDRIKEYLITDYKAIYDFRLEADDLCLIYSKNIKNSYICSPDKDMLMLEGNHFNYRTFQWVTTSKDEASYNFWISAIKGDSADNIKGIPGKGPVASKNLLDQSTSFRNTNYMHIVLEAFTEYFGEEIGIDEFYKNYKVLKIKDSYKDLVLVEPIKLIKEQKEENEQTERDSW